MSDELGWVKLYQHGFSIPPASVGAFANGALL